MGTFAMVNNEYSQHAETSRLFHLVETSRLI